MVVRSGLIAGRLAAPLGVLAALAAAGSALAHGGSTEQSVPPPEWNTAAPIAPPQPCSLDTEDPGERRYYAYEGWKRTDYVRYPGDCERLSFAHGPIVVKPGQNDQLVEPVVIAKPYRDGYMTRFKADLVTAEGIPAVEDIHLHHGTWLSLPSKGSTVSFAAAGEEKTILSLPRGFGMRSQPTDQWQLIHMVHSATPRTTLAWITYEIDFVPIAAARRLGIEPAYPIGISVRGVNQLREGEFPIFNTQRPFGGRDQQCRWPAEQCAAHDPWGRRFVGQGEPGNERGYDLRLPDRGKPFGPVYPWRGGTVISAAGHLHPGGLTTEIDLVRDGRPSRIFTSEALYWRPGNHHRAGAPPTSWDLSMTAVGAPHWGVRIRPGDVLRINATYDTKYASTYENMGIVGLWFTPDRRNGEPRARGVDPSAVPHGTTRGCWHRTGGLRASSPVLCERGVPTHGHHPSSGNHGGPTGEWRASDGGLARGVSIYNFRYLPGDHTLLADQGVPLVKLGSELNFNNLEGAGIFHTITTCKFPCMGPTSAAFPIADGETSRGRRIDLDSGQLGIGPPRIGPTKNKLNWSIDVTRKQGFRPGEIVTYFCRIHPFMRGSFKVAR